MHHRALLLDLDGTLVDSVSDLMASLNRLMADRALAPFTAPEVTAMVGDGAAALVGKAMAARSRQTAREDVDAFLLDYTAHAADETRPYPGAAETLDRLATGGWRIGICTNKPEAAARAVLDRLGLMTHLRAIGGGDTYPTRKPHPGHLLDLLRTMRMDPGEAVMVGDHHNDVAAARAAGLPCIFAAWGYGNLNMAEGAAAIAHSLRDLPQALADLP